MQYTRNSANKSYLLLLLLFVLFVLGTAGYPKTPYLEVHGTYQPIATVLISVLTPKP